MKKGLFILLGVSFALFACIDKNNEKPTGVSKSPNFVQIYIVANDLRLYTFEDQSIAFDLIGVFVTGDTIFSSAIKYLSDSEKERFNQLAKFYNDASYTGYVLPGENQALSETVASISVICDKDFDAEHKAGSSLGDIMNLCAASPYSFIQNNYTYVPQECPEECDLLPMTRFYGYRAVVEPLNNVNSGNTQMLYPIFHFYFTKKPQTLGEYNFTVTVKIGDTEITKSINYTFN